MTTINGKKYEPVKYERLGVTCNKCALFGRQTQQCRCNFLCTDYGISYYFKLIEEEVK